MADIAALPAIAVRTLASTRQSSSANARPKPASTKVGRNSCRLDHASEGVRLNNVSGNVVLQPPRESARVSAIITCAAPAVAETGM